MDIKSEDHNLLEEWCWRKPGATTGEKDLMRLDRLERRRDPGDCILAGFVGNAFSMMGTDEMEPGISLKDSMKVYVYGVEDRLG